MPFLQHRLPDSFKKQQTKGKLDHFTTSVSSLIVNIPQSQAPYNTSNADLVRLAKWLSVEWVDFSRVNCVSPYRYA